jgi:hypothetical protein
MLEPCLHPILWVLTMCHGMYPPLSITENCFTALKILCALPGHHSPSPPYPWQPLIILTVFMVLPFLECHSYKWVFRTTEWVGNEEDT